MSSSAAAIGGSFLSSVEAGRRFGYTSDYVAKLAREGKVLGTMIGQQWFVETESLSSFIQRAKEEKRQRAERIREERKLELMIARGASLNEARPALKPRALVLIKSGILASFAVALLCLALIGPASLPAAQTASITDALLSVRDLAMRLSWSIPSATPTPVAEHPDAPTTMSNYGREALIVTPDDRAGNIQQSFSDQVDVSFDVDGKSGVITPIFREPEDPDHYRFMLVPLGQ